MIKKVSSNTSENDQNDDIECASQTSGVRGGQLFGHPKH